MPFGVVSWIGRGMGVLDGLEIAEGKGQFWGKCGAAHCNQLGLCGVVIFSMRGGYATLPKFLLDFLLLLLVVVCFSGAHCRTLLQYLPHIVADGQRPGLPIPKLLPRVRIGLF